MKHLILSLYNSESRKIEPLLPTEKGGTFSIYTCGPTLYNKAHIGNFRTYVFEDLLRRTLRFFGVRVVQVMNFTDVDDKTIRGALEKQVGLFDYTKPYEEAFFRDLSRLHIEKVEHYPRATQYIGEMVQMIAQLLEKGLAYRGAGGDIFFSIRHCSTYGRLSHLDLSSLKAGASERVSLDEYEKEGAADFVLWKAYRRERDGSIYWDSPFGKGRPGWHIECSAMATSLLGETIDLHVGGMDNLFPHHENEIAQSEGCSGKLFVRHWAHCHHLVVDGKKMAKSLGNFYTLDDLLERGYTGEEIRYLLMATHYRTKLNFTLQGLDSARRSLQRLRSMIEKLKEVESEEGEEDFSACIEQTRFSFVQALSDDLRISSALASLFDFTKEVNLFCNQRRVSKGQANRALTLLREMNAILAVLPFGEKKEAIPEAIQMALRKRDQARKEKDWERADYYRAYIEKEGYQIEDGTTGSRLKKIPT